MIALGARGALPPPASEAQAAAEDPHAEENRALYALWERLTSGTEEERASALGPTCEAVLDFERRLDADPKDERAARWYAFFVQVLDSLPASGEELPFDASQKLARARDAAAGVGDWVLATGIAKTIAYRLRTEGRIAEAVAELEPVLEHVGEAGEQGPACALLGSTLAARTGRFERALELAKLSIDRAGVELEGDERHAAVASAHVQAGDVLLRMGIADRAGDQQDLAELEVNAVVDPRARRRARLEWLRFRCNADLGTQQYEALVARVGAALDDPALALAPGTQDRAEFELRLAIALADFQFSDDGKAARARALLEPLAASEVLNAVQRLRAQLWLLELDLREERGADASDRVARIETELARSDASSSAGLFDERAFFEALRAGWVHARIDALAPGSKERHELAEAASARARGAVDELFARWRETSERTGGVGFLGQRSRRMLLDEAMRLELESKPGAPGIEAAWDLLHRAQALGTHARTTGYEPLPLDEVRRLLCARGSGLITFLPSDVRTHVFLVDGAGIAHAELGPRSGWTAERERFVEALRQGADADPPRTSSELSDLAFRLGRYLLPSEVRERMRGWSGVAVVGADVLGYLPFEYLSLERGRWLYEELPVWYLPSVPFGCFLASREPARSAPDALDLFLVAASDAATPGFHFGASERDALTGGFDPAGVRVLSGADARLPAVEARHRAGDAIWHLIAHGTALEGELRPGLLLEGGAVLSSERVLGWKGSPRLALLSVCRAGQRRVRRGEDVPLDLGGAFLAAGASAAVLPRVAVEYRAQLALDARFLEHLRDGESPARALSEARGELATGEARFAHPFHGLVHVVGLGDRPVFPR